MLSLSIRFPHLGHMQRRRHDKNLLQAIQLYVFFSKNIIQMMYALLLKAGRPGALVCSEASSFSAACATSLIAVSNAAEGL